MAILVVFRISSRRRMPPAVDVLSRNEVVVVVAVHCRQRRRVVEVVGRRLSRVPLRRKLVVGTFSRRTKTGFPVGFLVVAVGRLSAVNGIKLFYSLLKKTRKFVINKPHVEHLYGRLLALFANIRLGWKGSPDTNALAYYEKS